MAINKIDLYLSQVKQLLNEGYTWLEKDNLGYGSIEAKFGANPVQIATIRKHPKLKDVETSLTIFNLIDDLDETVNKTKESIPNGPHDIVEQPMVLLVPESTSMEVNTPNSTNEAANVFAQL